MARILIVKRMGYGNKEINKVRINDFDEVYGKYRRRCGVLVSVLFDVKER
ncbi:hypothetical protein [Bacillus thuringiensis]|nr:hypothetical protein [Bacillus thuringiensis]